MNEVPIEKVPESIDQLFAEARAGVNRQVEGTNSVAETKSAKVGNNGGNGKTQHSEESQNSNNRVYPQQNTANQNQSNNNRFKNQQSNTNGNNSGGDGNSNGNGNGHITEKQVSLLFGLLAKAGIKDRTGYLLEEFNVDTDIKSMSKKQGSRVIDHLLKITNGAGV